MSSFFGVLIMSSGKWLVFKVDPLVYEWKSLELENRHLSIPSQCPPVINNCSFSEISFPLYISKSTSNNISLSSGNTKLLQGIWGTKGYRKQAKRQRKWRKERSLSKVFGILERAYNFLRNFLDLYRELFYYLFRIAYVFSLLYIKSM